jgi:hypothetical protein
VSFKVPNLDHIWANNPLFAEALESLRNGIDTMGQKLSVNPQGPTIAPSPPSAINVSAASGITHVSLQDSNPRTRNVHYFVEYDTNPNFSNAQTIHLGAARQVRVPTFLGTTYWRAYSQYADSPRSSIVYHGTTTAPTAVSDGAAGAGSSGLLLQTNGTNNGSQAKLNLTHGSGISLTDDGTGDVTIANTNSATLFSTSGQGWFSGPGMTDTSSIFMNSAANHLINYAVNTVVIFQFVLQVAWALSRVSYQLTAAGPGGSKFAFGIYSAAGNKLVDSGALDGTITSVQVASFGPVTLNAGTYYFAATTSDTSTLRGPCLQVGSVPIQLFAMVNSTNPLFATAANVSAAGVLPSTLGVLSSASGATVDSMPLPIWQV